MKKRIFPLLAVMLLAFWGGPCVVAQEEAPAGKPEVKDEVVKPETLSGTISMVLTEQKLVVVVSSTKVPYNFKVTGSTRIKIGGKKAKLADLAGQTGKTAFVKFLPLRSGNVAQSIEVSEQSK